MSINFLDIKHFILFSLLQYSTAMVLKSPKYYTSSIYIRKQSKTTFYSHNLYKARKSNDYNYKEWEDKKPDIYDYLLPSTNQTSTTASNIYNETSSKEMTNPELPTSHILDSSQYNTSFSSSATYPTLSSTELTPDTSSPASPTLTISTVSTPFSTLPSLSTPYNTTTTTLIQEVSTDNITTVTSTPLSIEAFIDPVKQFLRDEIKEAKVKLRGGYFTASVYVLLKIIERKGNTPVTSLLYGLRQEFHRLNSHHRLDIFGPMVSSELTSIVDLMATAPIELIKLQSKNGQELIENKRGAFQGDIKAAFDVIDAIYTEEDYINIVESLIDIQNFPDVSKRAIDVAEKAMETFIFVPYERIKGTPKEQLLLEEIYNVVDKRMVVEKLVIRRDYRKYVDFTAEMTASSEDIAQLKGRISTTAQIRKKFAKLSLLTEPTKTYSSKTDYTSLRHKMGTYKIKFKQPKTKERKLKTKRELTSTTTTTEILQKHNSKYYIRKNVKKYKYKMKDTTPKTILFTWSYYSKDNLKGKKYSSSKDSSDSENNYSHRDDSIYGNDANKLNAVKSIIPTNVKNNIIGGEKSKLGSEDIYKILSSDNKTDSSDGNAEAYLQVNLKDALFHTHNITIDRRFMKRKFNKLSKMDSFSDDEAILKSNIYKAFGYRNDFAKQLRAML